LRSETKRLRVLFEMLDSPHYTSFIKTLEVEDSKKDDQVKFRGGKIFVIIHFICKLFKERRRKFTEI